MALAVMLVVPASPASATSDYDSLLQATPILYVYEDGATKSQQMDISETWWHDFKQTYAKRAAQSIGWPTNFVSEFDNIVTSGGSWGVYIIDNFQGARITIVGTHDPNASCGFNGSASTGAYECVVSSGYGFVRAEYFTHNSFGGNGCGTWLNSCSDNGMNVYESPLVITGGGSYKPIHIPNYELSEYRFYIMNFDLNYPAGYAGEYISTLNTSAYTGTVDCGGEEPTYVLIAQAENNGAAPLTPLSLGRAEWDYNLSEGPYTLTVDCGGTLATSYGSTSPLPPTSNDWICDTYGDPPHYCVLS